MVAQSPYYIFSDITIRYFFACYRDGCHRNNGVLKARPTVMPLVSPSIQRHNIQECLTVLEAHGYNLEGVSYKGVLVCTWSVCVTDAHTPVDILAHHSHIHTCVIEGHTHTVTLLCLCPKGIGVVYVLYIVSATCRLTSGSSHHPCPSRTHSRTH